VDDGIDAVDRPPDIVDMRQVAHDGFCCSSIADELLNVAVDIEGPDVVPGPSQGADHTAPGPPVRRGDQDHRD
jgi:hypothetical protein